MSANSQQTNGRRAWYWAAVIVANGLLPSLSSADVVTHDSIKENFRPQTAVDRFHNYYKQQQFDRLYAEYDTEYSTEISLQKHIEMFQQAWTNLGGFVSATSAHAVVGTRAGHQVLIVTDLATFEGAATVSEEFDFKLGTTVGKMLAYKYGTSPANPPEK